jgi:hypothetical protein
MQITLNLIASVKVSVDKVLNCDGNGSTHWYWNSPTRGDSECFNSFAEAAQDAEESFQYYAEGF